MMMCAALHYSRLPVPGYDPDDVDRLRKDIVSVAETHDLLSEKQQST